MSDEARPPALPPKPQVAQLSIPPTVPPRDQPSSILSSSSPSSITTLSSVDNSPVQRSESSGNIPSSQDSAEPDTCFSPQNETQSIIDNSSHVQRKKGTLYNQNPSYGALPETDEIDQSEYDCLDYPIPFNKLVEENAVDLPLQVDVKESIYGMMGGDSLFENEKLDVHFMKYTDVVKISKSGVSNWLPLSSAYQCNVFTCKDGRFVAKKVCSDMENLLTTFGSMLPLVVYVTVGCKKSFTSSSIQAGELLIVKSIERTKKNKVKSMNCWSISMHKKKRLDSSCMAHFSINPEQTKVYIHDVIEHYDLPIYAIFYFSPSSVERMIVEEKLVMKSAIAKMVALESSDEILEIMLMAEFMTRKREVTNNYHAELLKKSRCLYEKFNPALVNKVIPTVCGFDSFQTKLFRHVLANWNTSTKLYYPRHTPPTLPKKRIDSSSAFCTCMIPSYPLPPLTSSQPPATTTPDTCDNEPADYEDVADNTKPARVKEASYIEITGREPRESSRPIQRYRYLHENHETLTSYTTKQVRITVQAADVFSSKYTFSVHCMYMYIVCMHVYMYVCVGGGDLWSLSPQVV